MRNFFFAVTVGSFYFTRAVFAVETPEGVKSAYTLSMIRIADQKLSTKKSTERLAAPESIELECYSTPGNEFYIGLKQTLVINAPLSGISAVLDGFTHYHEIFDDLKAVQIIGKFSTYLLTEWEQESPFFLIPNTRYELIYYINQGDPERKTYRYILNKQGDIKFDDGLIELRKVDERTTTYTEYDFFDANWGLASSMGAPKLWAKVLGGIVQSDLAIKYRAENLKKGAAQIKLDSRKKSQGFDFTGCINHKKTWDQL